VSRNHFKITRIHEDIFVVDEGSTVGTIVNGTRIGGPTSTREACCDRDENLVIAGSERSHFQFLLTIKRD
jgi:pSer/pThr/pTyr-binding forkhead associated (FHA) protein